MTKLKIEMCREAVELLGTGYTPDYYESAASGFANVAEHHIEPLTAALEAIETAASQNWHIRSKSYMVTTLDGIRKLARAALTPPKEQA